MIGRVFWVPTPPAANHYFTNHPYFFSNLLGVHYYPNSLDWRSQSGACKADVDGDGVVLAMTDGVLILRRMLGLSGEALTEGVTHTCVPLSPVGIAATISIASYDLDGDGVVRAETDGLLLLRAMLGFRNSALVSGAIGVSATRRTGAEIVSYLTTSCSFNLLQ